jgi:predicted GNAT superfamily acetyltransferase
MPRRGTRGTIEPMVDMQLDPPQATRDLCEQAAAAARRAADRAGIVVRPLETLAELEEGSQLITRIWDDGDAEPKAPTSLLRALVHAGNFVAGAFDGDRLVGISLGFFGQEDSELHLHSHITGIERALQGRSLGFALKQFQRSWALERGARTIVWTADPIVRGNAYFNLVKLGAAMVAYHENFYGVLQDGLNAGDSDRVVLRWDLASDRAVRAAEGTFAEPRPSGRVVLRARDDGAPEMLRVDGADELLVWLPQDIVRLREEDPQRAGEWRLASRETIGRALADGLRAKEVTRDGWLVLRR